MTEASSRTRALLRRPATARLAEPLAWLAALAVALPRLPPADASAFLAVAAVFLVIRLVADTGPNLLVAAPLEAAPYDERTIRRSLNRVKGTLALAAVILLHVVVLAAGPDGSIARRLLAGTGGPLWLVLGFLGVLLTYAVATPVVREHRGVPIARPSLGPTAGALLFLVLQAAGVETASALVALAAGAIAAGNVLGGGIQRYRAAAGRLYHPAFGLRHADPIRVGALRPVVERFLGGNALRVAPFLLVPAWPAVVLVLGGNAADPRTPVLAALLAGLPPVLFNAKSASLRFTIASLGAAGALFLLALSPLGGPVARGTTAVVLAYPLLSGILARGHARAATLVVLVLLVALPFSTDLPQPFGLPPAETLFLALAACVRWRCGRSPAQVVS